MRPPNQPAMAPIGRPMQDHHDLDHEGDRHADLRPVHERG